MQAVRIDGSHGEGGGQVLRTSLSLAALLGRELTIENIRAGRSKPGLAAQHVTCVRAAAAICGAQVEGDVIGSQVIHFRPGPLRAAQYRFDVADVQPSAGAASLVLQTLLPALAFAGGKSQLTVRGGTNVPWSPCYEYLAHVFVPAVQAMGVEVQVQRTQGGWYPRGGGELVAEMAPVLGRLAPLDLRERGALRTLTVYSTVSDGLPEHIMRRQMEAALRALPPQLAGQARRVGERPPGGPGTCVTIVARYESGHAGASALGERGKPAEEVGQEAAQVLAAFLDSGAAVDRHLGDQLLLYMALAEGRSVMLAEARTEHLQTNAWVIQQFLDTEILLAGERPVEVQVDGVGFRPR